METKLQELDRKLRTLKFSLGKSNEVIDTGNVEAISRNETSIKEIIEASHTLKDKIIELKFGKSETEEMGRRYFKDIHSDEKLVEIQRARENITKENQVVEKSKTLKQEIAL